MKQYSELTEEQKKSAREIHLGRLLESVIEVPHFFPELEERLNEARRKADKMQTPWFISEYIMYTCRKDLERMAEEQAYESQYSEPDDLQVISGVVL